MRRVSRSNWGQYSSLVVRTGVHQGSGQNEDLSSGLSPLTAFVLHQKGVLDELRSLFVDADHVETDTPAKAIMHLHVQEGGSNKVMLLPLVDGTGRFPEAFAVPLLHLHKDEAPAFFGDDIDLAEPVPVIPLDDPVAFALEGSYGHLFASQTLVAATHLSAP